MPFNQHDLDPVGVTIDIDDLIELRRDLERASDQVKEHVTKAIHAFGGEVYDAAKANLTGEVLQVRTGRLRGAWVQRKDDLAWLAEDDVFYGAIHEAGNYPWLQPAWDGAGGDEAVVTAIRKGLDEGMKVVNL